MNTYLVWSAYGYSDKPKSIRAYDEASAAKEYASLMFSAWDYPDYFELFVKDTEINKVSYIEISVETQPDFIVSTPKKEKLAWELAYALTAPARWSD